jgi:prophage maintenance system killer protein
VNEPLWISKKAVLAMHSEQLTEHGGSDGIRDETLLKSALAKPLNVFAYSDEPDIFRLAASYAFGIARNRAFLDGDKRTALAVPPLFWTGMAGILLPQKRISTLPFSISRRAPSARKNWQLGLRNMQFHYEFPSGRTLKLRQNLPRPLESFCP